MYCSLYDKDTGEIVSFLSGPKEIIELNRKNSEFGFLDGDYSPDTYYVVGGRPVPRPQQETVLVAGVLERLPVPCTININGQTYACNETTAEISFDQPGTYKVLVESWPYLPKEFTIENQTQ